MGSAIVETKPQDAFAAVFARQADGLPGPESIARLRATAAQRISENGFPTVRNEEWKYTNTARLLRNEFGPAPMASANPEEITVPAGARRLVFVNGRFAPDLSTGGKGGDGVEVLSLAQALEQAHPVLISSFGQVAAFDQPSEAFAALNTALASEGAFVHIPAGRVVEAPIYLVFVTKEIAGPALIQPRIFVAIGDASQATVVETYQGPDESVYLNNVVAEAVLGTGAVLHYVKVQQEGEKGAQISTFQASQQRDSQLKLHTYTLSGGLVRNDANSVLNGEGCDCTAYGLYTTAGAEHVDNHTLFDHASPNCTSNELYKGILSGKSTGVFNGKIIVRKDAQKTNAYQNNKNMLIGREASINTKPQLEIFADDVRCTHGATVGQLEEDLVFYFQARGIGREQARLMLIQAFAGELLEELPVAELRETINRAIAAHLAGQ